LTTPPTVSIVVRPDDILARRPPVERAIARLRDSLSQRGVGVELVDRSVDPQLGSMVIIGDARITGADDLLSHWASSLPHRPEALALIPVLSADGSSVVACGNDERGLAYAVLDIVDRIEHAGRPFDALRLEGPVVESPRNAVRSVARLFTSEVYDKSWFYDEGFWRRYLAMLVSQRFNRFNLTLGLGYNFPWRITDAYMYFAYPFLVDVPGYFVRVPQLPDEERERNLETLRFISEEAVANGLEFFLGLWTHAYEWFDSPKARHTIEGLTPDRHAAYCRDALRTVLDSCPAISGLTIRTHGESGIPERSWGFWRTVLDGVVQSDRRVCIDLHAKGLGPELLEIARETGMPLTLSPKYAAEHMGLPYHQAAIRELDRPPAPDPATPSTGKARFMAVSEGSRPFTRYGFGDFLVEDRTYDVVFRIWPGTQRLLQWGDPAMAAGFGRHSGLAGSSGVEWCEPLSFRGREGSGASGSRNGYADSSLSPADDWKAHEYAYRLFGRLTYGPDSNPEVWRRFLRREFGLAAADAEPALASAGRILPLVTTAHHPSASNNYYWPEIYTDMPVVGGERAPEPHYYDTPEPKRFATVGPLDPEIFSSVVDFVDEVCAGRRSGRYSPLEVARRLEEHSGNAAAHLARLKGEPKAREPALRRLIVDVSIQEALGRFFAGKMRAAVWHELSVRSGNPAPLRNAVAAYRAARAAWMDAVDAASGVYLDDLAFGPEPHLRGTWADRLAAIDRDIEALMTEVDEFRAKTAGVDEEMHRLMAEMLSSGPEGAGLHRSPADFRPGDELTLILEPAHPPSAAIESAALRYRHVDQSKRYVEVEMSVVGGRFIATIPAKYTDSPYAIQYFFVLRDDRGAAWLHPGLDEDLSNQPYYVVCGRRHGSFRE
jgi:hypothetical protein